MVMPILQEKRFKPGACNRGKGNLSYIVEKVNKLARDFLNNVSFPGEAVVRDQPPADRQMGLEAWTMPPCCRGSQHGARSALYRADGTQPLAGGPRRSGSDLLGTVFLGGTPWTPGSVAGPLFRPVNQQKHPLGKVAGVSAATATGFAPSAGPRKTPAGWSRRAGNPVPGRSGPTHPGSKRPPGHRLSSPRQTENR